MTKIQMLELLETHEVFSGLEQHELLELGNIISSVCFKEGETVFLVGSAPSYIYYVVDGGFELHFPNNETMTIDKRDVIGELGLLNGDFRLGSLRSKKNTTVIRICGTNLFNEEKVKPSTALKIVRKLGKRVTNFFRAAQQISSVEIIKQGESEHIEFKSTLRWNLYTDKKDKKIEHAVLKTIAGFLNTKGGHLFIGVNDDGEILGLGADKFGNDDKILLHLNEIIKTSLGTLFLKDTHISIEQYELKKFLRVDCFPSNRPVYIKNGNDEMFYIRTGPSTTNLSVSKIFDYIKNRFELKNIN